MSKIVLFPQDFNTRINPQTHSTQWGVLDPKTKIIEADGTITAEPIISVLDIHGAPLLSKLHTDKDYEVLDLRHIGRGLMFMTVEELNIYLINNPIEL